MPARAPRAGLFSECYSNSEDRAFALLVRRNRSWSRTTCLHLAAEADTKAFFAHEGVQVRGWLQGGGPGEAAAGGVAAVPRAPRPPGVSAEAPLPPLGPRPPRLASPLAPQDGGPGGRLGVRLQRALRARLAPARHGRGAEERGQQQGLYFRPS